MTKFLAGMVVGALATIGAAVVVLIAVGAEQDTRFE